jgi:hypothetical protein
MQFMIYRGKQRHVKSVTQLHRETDSIWQLLYRRKTIGR